MAVPARSEGGSWIHRARFSAELGSDPRRPRRGGIAAAGTGPAGGEGVRHNSGAARAEGGECDDGPRRAMELPGHQAAEHGHPAVTAFRARIPPCGSPRPLAWEGSRAVWMLRGSPSRHWHPSPPGAPPWPASSARRCHLPSACPCGRRSRPSCHCRVGSRAISGSSSAIRDPRQRDEGNATDRLPGPGREDLWRRFRLEGEAHARTASYRLIGAGFVA